MSALDDHSHNPCSPSADGGRPCSGADAGGVPSLCARVLGWCSLGFVIAGMLALNAALQGAAGAVARQDDAADGMVVQMAPSFVQALYSPTLAEGGGSGGGAPGDLMDAGGAWWIRLAESGGPFLIVWAVLMGSALTLYRMIYKPERAAGRLLKEKELDVEKAMVDSVAAAGEVVKQASSAASAAAASAATAAADARVASENGLRTVELLERRLEREELRAARLATTGS